MEEDSGAGGDDAVDEEEDGSSVWEVEYSVLEVQGCFSEVDRRVLDFEVRVLRVGEELPQVV